MNTKLLKDLMEKGEITQRMLSSRTGISTTGLNQIIKGRVKPKTETIEKIAAALGISAGVLMNPSSGPVHIQSGNINNIMGNHNGIGESKPGTALFYGTGEMELLKSEVNHLREVLKSKDETIETLRMLIEQYKNRDKEG